MADDLLGRLSGTGNPYAMNTYTPAANEKNTLTITDYFKLLAAQLANQDMTNPMDNSEMMAQMTQMAMIQAVSAMTESVQTSTSVSTQVYAAGLVGQGDYGCSDRRGEVWAGHGGRSPVWKSGIRRLYGKYPGSKADGDDNEYPLSYVLGMGKIDDPYKKDEADGKQTKEKDVESEKTDFPAYDYAAEEGNPLTDKGILA
ncbi:MAG: flagellar hook capping FlgD N-terminal domain-containing protein [Enterocloster clostridioformis]